MYTNTQLCIYYFMALLAIVAANSKPQSAISSSLAFGQELGKRLTTPELTLYLTRDIIKALQADKPAKISVSQPSVVENSQKRNRGFVSRFFLPDDKAVKEIQKKNELSELYLESLKNHNKIYEQLQSSQQNNGYIEENQIQINANSAPHIPVSYKNQEEILLHEQLKHQWNSILDHNNAHLQGLPTFQQLSQDEQRSADEKEIESILRNHEAFASPDHDHNQSPPILIHKEVKITKHVPVPVYQGAEVPVPKPVLVPVPEPYLVKVPHPYSVPVNIVKHIPRPIVRHF